MTWRGLWWSTNSGYRGTQPIAGIGACHSGKQTHKHKGLGERSLSTFLKYTSHLNLLFFNIPCWSCKLPYRQSGPFWAVSGPLEEMDVVSRPPGSDEESCHRHTLQREGQAGLPVHTKRCLPCFRKLFFTILFYGLSIHADVKPPESVQAERFLQLEKVSATNGKILPVNFNSECCYQVSGVLVAQQWLGVTEMGLMWWYYNYHKAELLRTVIVLFSIS